VNIYYLNYHYDSVSVHARPVPLVLLGEGDAPNPAPMPRSLGDLARALQGQDVLFVTHGFNVDYAAGLRSIGRFVKKLDLPETVLVVGVLWPGDFYALGVNYPAASVGAIDAGQSLGNLCNADFAGANSFSFVSHSLGARVVLEATERLDKKARLVCVTAGAVNDDCLSAEYAEADNRALVTRTLSSTNDWVLQVLFRIGDPVSQVLDHLPVQLGTDDHAPFHAALGRFGPNPGEPAPVYAAQIPDAEVYDHGNYLAPSDQAYQIPPVGSPLSDANKWFQVAQFVSQSFRNETPDWPPPYVPAATLRPWYEPFIQKFWPL
jgi:hypothetical protein